MSLCARMFSNFHKQEEFQTKNAYVLTLCCRHATCVDLDLKIWEMRTCNAPLMGAEVHEEGVENISILKVHALYS